MKAAVVAAVDEAPTVTPSGGGHGDVLSGLDDEACVLCHGGVGGGGRVPDTYLCVDVCNLCVCVRQRGKERGGVCE